MAISAADFVTKFPEFEEINSSSPDLVQRALDDAQIQLSSKVFGTRYEQAVYLRAGHILALSPFGEFARISETDETIYSRLFRQLRRALPYRGLVV